MSYLVFLAGLTNGGSTNLTDFTRESLVAIIMEKGETLIL